MRQLSLKLNTYIKSAGDTNDSIEKLILNIIMGIFGALAFFYVFFLGNMVMNIVERRSLEADALSLSGEVGDLELAYLSRSSDINLALSYSMGFRETKTMFITRKSISFLSSSDESLSAVRKSQNEF